MKSFDLGRTVATPAALAALTEAGLSAYGLLARHAAGDWGDLTLGDKRANEDALESGARIFSSYVVGDGKLWVITDAADDDGRRQSTCILRPDEY